MKPSKQIQPNKALSLKKSTIMRLNQMQSLQIKGGLAAESEIPQSCGIVCGDCMSTLQTLLCLTRTQLPV